MKITSVTILLFCILLASAYPTSAGRKSVSSNLVTKAAFSGRTVQMTFEFIDACDDNYSPEIEFYMKENPSNYWGTFWLQYYNDTFKSRISCEQGKDICFGAWLNNESWGCGKKCTEIEKGACFPCQEATVAIGLECNR